MYKTIRHGENSLQYTILPQNDDFRIEGKLLTSAESNFSSNTGRRPKTKRRRSFFAYLGLIFVCTVIVGAVLIPFLVSAECLPNPSQWFMGKNIEKHEKTASPLKNHGSVIFGSPHGSFMGNGVNIGKTVKILNQSGVEKIILRVNKTNDATENKNQLPKQIDGNLNNQTYGKLLSNEIHQDITSIDTHNGTITETQNQKLEAQTRLQNDQNTQENYKIPTISNSNENLLNYPPAEHFVTEVRFEPVETVSSMPLGIVPTIVVTTLRTQSINNEIVNQERDRLQQQQKQQQQEQQSQNPILQAQIAPNVRPTSTFSSSNLNQTNNGSLPAPTSTLMTRIIQVPLLKSASKKPIVPPILVKTKSSQSDMKKSYENLDATTTSSQLPDIPSLMNDFNDEMNPNVEPAKPTNWMHSHWLIDPSTYFQWTGYKAEDSVLLPALLGFALIGIILIITVCLVARKRTTNVRRRHRNASDVEEAGAEDNTTLLTTTNLSDED